MSTGEVLNFNQESIKIKIEHNLKIKKRTFLIIDFCSMKLI